MVEQGGPLLPAAALLVLLLAAVVSWVWLRQRRKRREMVEAALLRRLSDHVPSHVAVATEPSTTALPSAPAPGEIVGTVVVSGPAGECHHVTLTRRPLTMGRSPSCDIVIDDMEVRPEHARLRAISHDEVQIHAIAPSGSGPSNGREDDVWLIVRSGERMALGSHYLQISMGTEIGHAEEDERPRLAEAG